MVVPTKASMVVIEPSGILGIKPANTSPSEGAAITSVEINTKLIKITSKISAFSTTLCLPLYSKAALKKAISGVHSWELT